MYLSLGQAARKQCKDKCPHTRLWNLKAEESINMCSECSLKKRNIILDRHRFFAETQEAFNRAISSGMPVTD